MNTRHYLRPDSALAAEFWEKGKSASCPVYDMHGHQGPFFGIWFPRGAIDDMIRSMDDAGVRVLCFASHVSLFCPEISNTTAIADARRFPGRLRVYLAINPHYPDAITRDLAAYDQHADVCVGLKLLPSYHRVPATDDRYRAALEFANARGLLVLIHTWGGDSCNDATVCRTLAGRYPRNHWVLGHSLNNHWDEAVSIANEFPNTYLELTSIPGLRGVIELFAAKVGSHRLLFGTDLPWFAEHQGIGAILSADLTDADRHNILHRNAEKLLGLPVT